MSKRLKIEIPSPEEDAAIDAGITADPDTYELSKSEFAQLKHVRLRGRPAGSGQKEQITVRFDTEVITAFRASGAGWQTRMNNALRDWLKTHPAR